MPSDSHKPAKVAAAHTPRIHAAITRGEAEVGIWFWPHRKIVQWSLPVSEAVEHIGHLVGPSEHLKFWENIRHQTPELNGLEYDECPRGRVSFRLADQKFVILCGSRVLNSTSAQNAIKRSFQLKGVPVVVEHDDHYDRVRTVGLL